MTLRTLRPPILAAALAAVMVSAGGTPARALTDCGQAAHAYATQQVSLVEPLKTLQGCIEARLDKSGDKPDPKAAKKDPKELNWHGCRATAARYVGDADALSPKDLVELHACLGASIEEFK